MSNEISNLYSPKKNNGWPNFFNCEHLIDGLTKNANLIVFINGARPTKNNIIITTINLNFFVFFSQKCSFMSVCYNIHRFGFPLFFSLLAKKKIAIDFNGTQKKKFCFVCLLDQLMID